MNLLDATFKACVPGVPRITAHLLNRCIDLGAEDTKPGVARKIPETTEVFELMRECVRGKKTDDSVFTRAMNDILCVSVPASEN